MYLSRIRLGESQAARSELVNAMHKGVYGDHQLLWRLFTEEEQRSFLFRHEQSDGRLAPAGEPIFYVLSREQPKDTENLFQVETRPFTPQLTAGQPLEFQIRVNPTICRQGKRHDILMDAQQQWLFDELKQQSLAVTGTKKDFKNNLLDLASDTDLERWQAMIENGVYRDELATRLGRKKILELALKTISEQALLEWWESRGKTLGFKYQPNAGGLQIDSYLQHRIRGKKTGATFSSVDLSGRLIVEDPDVFLTQLNQGIGRAKAFGCGLMMIRRI